MVKRRTFKDLDITKDFQNRLEKKNLENIKENFNNKNIKLEDMSLKELELYQENQIEKLEKDKKDDVYSKIIIEDLR
jgi:hypothetical protein